MAMTKKERAAMDNAINKLAIVAALRWTDPVDKDLPHPTWENHGADISGWDYRSHGDYPMAYEAWSEMCAHGDGPKRTSRICGSQNGVDLYSTKLLALKACRHEVEKEAARKLAKIDRMIEEEKSNAKPNNPAAAVENDTMAG